MDSVSEGNPLQWLLRAESRGIQPGLERMERLLSALGNPEKKLRCLHVAGTNGKGSVCAFAESVLCASGYRVGLYTSPHLVDFSERIRIDGAALGEAQLGAGLRRLKKAVSGWSEEEMPTFFELVTALAFDCFAQAGCELVVLETGLGGRLDATNTAPKLACAITPIALDHTEWLGETLREIALEKAGILRPGVPVVSAPQEPGVVEELAAAARALGAPLTQVTELLDPSLRLGLAGSHQRRNATLALALLRSAGFDLPAHGVARGLAEVSWPGRFQRLRGGELVLDGAHNLHAARQLVVTWREEYGERPCRLIFGALTDKDPEAILNVLEPIAGEILLVPVASPRSADPSLLLGGRAVPTRSLGSLKEALDPEVGFSTDPQAPVLLTGSLFLVGEALALESGGEAAPRSQ